MTHILVADDDHDLRQLIGVKLRTVGMETTTARDGHEAVDLLDNGRFDAAVLDVMMPGLTGLDVLRHLRSTTRPHLPVLMISAAGSPAAVAALHEAGADAYLSKPFSLTTLVATLEGLLPRDEPAVSDA